MVDLQLCLKLTELSFKRGGLAIARLNDMFPLWKAYALKSSPYQIIQIKVCWLIKYYYYVFFVLLLVTLSSAGATLLVSRRFLYVWRRNWTCFLHSCLNANSIIKQ